MGRVAGRIKLGELRQGVERCELREGRRRGETRGDEGGVEKES